MANEEPWLRAEIGGTKQAGVITKPEILTVLIKKATHPLIIAGNELGLAGTESEALIHFIALVSRYKRAPLIATSYSVKDLIARGIRLEAVMGAMEITQRLCDPDWKGLDGRGRYDLILMAGLPYSFAWVILSGLKNGAPESKTVCLNPRYQPHATWSMPNKKEKAWEELLEKAGSMLEKEAMKPREDDV